MFSLCKVLLYSIQIFPSEINNILLRHPAVVDAATVAVNDPHAGQVPHCFVARKHKVTLSECVLKQTLRGKSVNVVVF